MNVLIKNLIQNNLYRYPLWLHGIGLAALILLYVLAYLELDGPKFKKLALVVGNQDYHQTEMDLDNPENDAKAMHASLSTLGFESQLLLNSSKASFNQSLSSFLQRARAFKRQGDKVVTLVYYAGHGIQFDHVNYLVPVDSNLMSTPVISSELLQQELISLKLATDKLATLEAELNVLILDACRDLPIEELKGQIGGWADIVQQNFFVAFGTAPGERALDGTGANHGVFTQAILNHLQTPGLALSQLFQLVRKEVMSSTDMVQIPQDSNQSTVELIINSQSWWKHAPHQLWLTFAILFVWLGAGQLIVQRNKNWQQKINVNNHSEPHFVLKDLKTQKVVSRFSEGVLNLGRGKTNEACIEDTQQQVSRIHCQILTNNEQSNFWLQEIQASTNGTYLEMFGKSKKLKAGKKYPLQLGQVFYLVAEKDQLGARPFTIALEKGDGT